MHEGMAKGGPRDGVKLAAGASWDGRVKQGRTHNSQPVYYPGQYMWYEPKHLWIWVPDYTDTPRRS